MLQENLLDLWNLEITKPGVISAALCTFWWFKTMDFVRLDSMVSVTVPQVCILIKTNLLEMQKKKNINK